jgi:ABC-type polysaccharide/polyol phosphate export permease
VLEAGSQRGREEFVLPFTDMSKEIVYTPDSVRQGWHLWGTVIREFWSNRELISRLVTRDLSARYRQSALTYIWAVFPWLATVAIFAVLKRSGTLPVSDTPIPYVAYALWGMSLWQLFAGCLAGSTASLTTAGSLITKLNFSKDVLVFASIGSPLFDFAVRLLTLTPVFIWYQVPLHGQMVLMPIILLSTVLLALGLGFVLSIANLILRDIGHALTVALTLGMFITPVLYPPNKQWPFLLLNVVNPVSPLVIASQDLIAYGNLSMPQALIFSCAFSLIIFLGGWRFFRSTLPRVTHLA